MPVQVNAHELAQAVHDQKRQTFQDAGRVASPSAGKGGDVAFRFSRDDWCVALLEWSFEREEPLRTDNFVVRQGAPGFV